MLRGGRLLFTSYVVEGWFKTQIRLLSRFLDGENYFPSCMSIDDNVVRLAGLLNGQL